jgi:N-acetylmuramic acid 6-phosphate etherase
VLLREQQAAASAAARASTAIAAAADRIAAALDGGGSLHYFGAGTSGRLAVLDAVECPPTFGTPPSLVRAHIAGGDAAFVRAIEGAEDDAAAGAREADAAVRGGDAVLGISASGSARYVIGAVERARSGGALTFALTSDGRSPLARAAEYQIVAPTGAEALAGSTRLGAGTAQKIVLGVLSTAVMVRLNRVYGNLMVDVTASNEKLRGRALRLVRALLGASEADAAAYLAADGGNVRLAVVMQRRGLDASAAAARLQAARGSLREAIGER